MARQSRPLVSVVIPTLNAGDRLDRLLETIQAQRVPGGVEILVIDSRSRDGTPERARHCGARVLSTPRRQFGHGRTRNRAIQEAAGEHVALTVQDALPADEHWLARLIEPLLQQTEVAGSYGLQVAPPSAGLQARTSSALWCLEHGRPQVKSLAAPEQFWRMSPQERLQLVRFDNVTSCVKRAVWEQVPFPERDYGEDMSWAQRVLLAGYRITYVPAAQVWHCHERGWPYELRRAYVDGYARVDLVGWPSPALRVKEVGTILRRLLFFARTDRFDRIVEPQAAREILFSEVRQYEPLAHHPPAQVYLDSLAFALGLTDRAIDLCPAGVFPEKAWANLLRFALAVTAGQALGAASATKLARPAESQGLSGGPAGPTESLMDVRVTTTPVLERGAWGLLHCFLHRGV
jgi:rhamnosyltransferase